MVWFPNSSWLIPTPTHLYVAEALWMEGVVSGGQTTSKPFIHGAPSYSLQNFSGNPKQNSQQMKF